jgi:hypothetical protein
LTPAFRFAGQKPKGVEELSCGLVASLRDGPINPDESLSLLAICAGIVSFESTDDLGPGTLPIACAPEELRANDRLASTIDEGDVRIRGVSDESRALGASKLGEVGTSALAARPGCELAVSVHPLSIVPVEERPLS